MILTVTHDFGGCKNSVPVEWHDATWRPAIRRVAGPLSNIFVLPDSTHRHQSLKPMKNNFSYARRRAAFTLVELLVVIAIIGILAAMLLPALSGVGKAARIAKAKTEMADIVNAINAYDADYSRFPITKPEQTTANQYSEFGHNDLTVGLVFGSGNGTSYNGNSGLSYYGNTNVIAILMDLQTFPNGVQTLNYGHGYNPKQVKYLNAKMSGYDPTSNDPNPPGGVDNTGVYRDPWGNPYIITMDTDYDEQASDLLYTLRNVSQNGNGTAGLNGLSNTNSANPNTDNFLYHGKVMVWSAGPDKKYDSTVSGNVGVNKDNVLSWK